MNIPKHQKESEAERDFSRTAFEKLMEKTMLDSTFRDFLQSDPEAALSSMGITISDPSIRDTFLKHLGHNDEALLADGQKKKIFAVGTSVSIVVAASTPAFPKGDDPAD